MITSFEFLMCFKSFNKIEIGNLEFISIQIVKYFYFLIKKSETMNIFFKKRTISENRNLRLYHLEVVT